MFRSSWRTPVLTVCLAMCLGLVLRHFRGASESEIMEEPYGPIPAGGDWPYRVDPADVSPVPEPMPARSVRRGQRTEVATPPSRSEGITLANPKPESVGVRSAAVRADVTYAKEIGVARQQGEEGVKQLDALKKDLETFEQRYQAHDQAHYAYRQVAQVDEPLAYRELRKKYETDTVGGELLSLIFGDKVATPQSLTVGNIKGIAQVLRANQKRYTDVLAKPPTEGEDPDARKREVLAALRGLDSMRDDALALRSAVIDWANLLTLAVDDARERAQDRWERNWFRSRSR